MSAKGETNLKAFESLVKVANEELKMNAGKLIHPIQPWNGLIELERVSPVSRQWYFCVECPKCKRTSPAFRDYSDGKLGASPFPGSGEIRLKCHYCPQTIRASAPQIVAAQWA